MIRVEIIDPRGHYVQTKDFSKDVITCGRGLDCDVIIPDFKFALQEVAILRREGGYQTIHQQKEHVLSGEQVIKLHGYKIRIINLMHFQNEQNAEIKDRDWILSAVLLAVVIINSVLGDLLLDPNSTDPWGALRNLSSVLIVVAIISVGLSLLSRAVNGEYRIWQVTNRLLVAILALIVVQTNLVGLRWLGPQLLWNEAIWGFIYFIGAGILMWSLSNAIFEHVSPKIRRGLITFAIVLSGIANYMTYFPGRDSYRYPQISPTPPLPALFESKPLTKDKLVEEMSALF